jgi:hypothetical protein
MARGQRDRLVETVGGDDRIATRMGRTASETEGGVDANKYMYLKPSAQNEQLSHGFSQSGANMKCWTTSLLPRAEEAAESRNAVRSLEAIGLVDLDPRQRAPPGAEPSRVRVKAFSSASSALRASSHFLAGRDGVINHWVLLCDFRWRAAARRCVAWRPRPSPKC